MDQIDDLLDTPVLTISQSQSLTVLQLLLAIGLVILVLLFARVFEKRITGSLKTRNVNADLIQLIRRSFYVLVLVVLFITLLDLLNVPLAAFAFVTGAVAIGVGFGAQNIINNFISGWILMWERPIRLGDFLEVGDMKGTVEAINTRSTMMKRVDGVHMLIPNSQLLENTVINWTLVDRKMRTTVRVGVAYGSDVQKVRELLKSILEANDDVLKTPAPSVIFEDFGDSALIFDAYFWVESSAEREARAVRSAIRFEIDRVLAENGVTIAFPQRDVHIDGAIKITR